MRLGNGSACFFVVAHATPVGVARVFDTHARQRRARTSGAHATQSVARAVGAHAHRRWARTFGAHATRSVARVYDAHALIQERRGSKFSCNLDCDQNRHRDCNPYDDPDPHRAFLPNIVVHVTTVLDGDGVTIRVGNG